MASYLRHSMLVTGLLILGSTVHSQQNVSTSNAPVIRLTALGAIYPDESYAYGVNDWGDVVGRRASESNRGSSTFMDFSGAGRRACSTSWRALSRCSLRST